MKCLSRVGFFEKLDDELGPQGASQARQRCSGDYRVSGKFCEKPDFELSDFADILGVLRSQGGFCDCEILYNAVESSRLKAEYWRSQAGKVGTQPAHQSHPSESK
jgi:hypothetical protein